MKRTFLLVVIFTLLTTAAIGCTFDPVRPQAVYEATATARAQLVEIVPPAPTVVPEVLPTEEVGEVVPDPTPAPPCVIIKGNISASGEKIFHVPGQANYNNVKIDEAAGEKFFCSEDEAIAAGWRKAKR